jgi:hypothetical protein
MYLRDDAPNGSMLRDVGHTIAHPKRDRGWAWEHVNDFSAQVREVFTNGGLLQVPVLFEVHALIGELTGLLTGLDIEVNAAKMHARARPFALQLAKLMDGTEISVPEADVRLQGFIRLERQWGSPWPFSRFTNPSKEWFALSALTVFTSRACCCSRSTPLRHALRLRHFPPAAS